MIAIVAKAQARPSRPSALRVLARVRWAANSEQMRRGCLSGEAAVTARALDLPSICPSRRRRGVAIHFRFDQIVCTNSASALLPVLARTRGATNLG